MRSLDNNLLVELAKPNIKPIILVTVELESETLYMTDAFIDINWNGNTYLATNGLVSIGQIDESQDLIVSTLTVTLSGVVTEHVSRLIAQNYLDKPLTVHFGVLNRINQLAGDPFVYFEGRIDEPSISDDPSKTTSISVKAANVWVDFSRKTGRFFNHKSQQLYYPGDNGFEYCAQDRKNLVWGR